MPRHRVLRKLESFEVPRVVPLTGRVHGACFFLMKLLPARFMLERAAERGELRPGALICETTSGTFGLALAMLAAQLGYRLTLVSDSAIDPHLYRRLCDLGARLDIVRDPPHGTTQQARLDRVHAHLRSYPDSYWPAQYSNADNPLAYSKVAAHLIDSVGEIDCLVGTVGSGGSMCGTASYLRLLFPELAVIGVDTPNSVLFGQPDGKRMLRGLGGSMLPPNLDHAVFDEIHWVPAAEAFRATRALHRKYGLYMGGTSGAAYKVASWWARRNPDRTVVVLLPDEGHRYVETIYNDAWLRTVPGWNNLPATEPLEVPVPTAPIAAWSRLRWSRRSLAEVMSQAPLAPMPASQSTAQAS